MNGCDKPAIPPPPPPPPLAFTPLDDVGTDQPGSIICIDHKTIKSEDLGRQAYNDFVNHPDTICKYLENQCYLSFYRPVQPILQKGPLCGMVALSMAGSLLNKRDITAERILEQGISMRYSCRGEMFSADWMIDLAQETLGCDAEQLEMTDGRSAVLWRMLKGALLLVPYDADKNHYPCLKKGHKAHWALITGFFVVLDKSLEPTLKEYLPVDCEVENLYHCKDAKQLAVVQHKVVKSAKIIYVFAQHGKSKHPGIWPLDNLLASNANIREMDPERARDGKDYIVPSGGIRHGLCGRIVLISNKKCDKKKHCQGK